MPATATLPGPVRVNEMVGACTGSSNTAVGAAEVATLVARSIGETELTTGGVTSGGWVVASTASTQ